MGKRPGAKPHAQKALKVAIYDVPKPVSELLSAKLRKAGHNVLFEGTLNEKTARTNADVWFTRWCYNLKSYLLTSFHPRQGIITLSSGTDHIEKPTTRRLGLRVENCPDYCAPSVTEHALALSLRSVYRRSLLPPLSRRAVVFGNFDDRYAESAIAQMLFRVRQLDKAIERAKNLDFSRCEQPWTNKQLTASTVGIIGHDRSAISLAGMLKYGFGCTLLGCNAAPALEALGLVDPATLATVLRKCDYVFLCSDEYMYVQGRNSYFDSRLLDQLSNPLGESGLSVLGAGNIGSNMALSLKRIFKSRISFLSRRKKPKLEKLGMTQITDLGSAIKDSDFSYICLPLSQDTRSLLNNTVFSGLNSSRKRVLVNTARAEIVDCEALLKHLGAGISVYATDVLPYEAQMIKGGEPDRLLRTYIEHPNVIATAHEADCSQKSKVNLVAKAMEKLNIFSDA